MAATLSIMAGPKSILKHSSLAKAPPSDRPEAPRFTERHREIAVHHATLLQQQKDVEAQVVEHIEELIDFPANPQAEASCPSASDVERFSDLLQPFQVSDYDSLIEERNAANKCGYTFCGNSKPSRPQTGAQSVIRMGARGRDMEVVSSNRATMFCSGTCGRRALFIKVQLSEVPAWERAGGLGRPIEVMEERDEEALERKIKRLNIDGGGHLEDALEELALERGEAQTSAKSSLVMSGPIKENLHAQNAWTLSVGKDGEGNGVEGYPPRLVT